MMRTTELLKPRAVTVLACACAMIGACADVDDRRDDDTIGIFGDGDGDGAGDGDGDGDGAGDGDGDGDGDGAGDGDGDGDGAGDGDGDGDGAGDGDGDGDGAGDGDGDGDGAGDGDGDGDGDGGSPYQGGWDIGDCQEDVVATANQPGQFDPGDVIPDWTLTDAYGDQVRLYDFCHKALYYEIVAHW